KVATQALRLAVRMTGVAPISTQQPTPDQGSSAVAQSTGTLVSEQQLDGIRNAMLKTRTRALFDLADTLSANHGLVTEANKDATAASIRARLSAQLQLLKLDMPASSP